MCYKFGRQDANKHGTYTNKDKYQILLLNCKEDKRIVIKVATQLVLLMVNIKEKLHMHIRMAK